jgi:hypothetical protein
VGSPEANVATTRKRVRPAQLSFVDVGRYESLWQDKDYPKIQFLTIEGLLNERERAAGAARAEAPCVSTATCRLRVCPVRLTSHCGLVH